MAELLARVRAGDEAALAELLRCYEPRLRLAARRLLGPLLRPYLDSLDLVQSVHRVLLQGVRGNRFDLSGPEPLLAVALTVIRRKVADNWRRTRRQPSQAGPPPEEVASTHPGDDPARALAVRDTIEQILGGLQGDEREVVELRLQGFSTAEVAARLGLDPHLLRARLSRLRARLRRAGCDAWL